MIIIIITVLIDNHHAVTPLPIVIITVGIRFKDYGVKDTCGTLL